MTVTFIPRGSSPSVTISVDDVVQRGTDAIRADRVQRVEVPREVSVVYLSPENDFQQSEALSIRPTVSSGGREIVEIPVVMDADLARAIAERYHYGLSFGVTSRQFLTGLKYGWLTATDVITLTDDNASRVCVIDSLSIGADGTVDISATDDLPAAWSITATGYAGDAGEQTVTKKGPTLLTLIDGPLLPLYSTDDGHGFYVAMSSLAAGWRGGVLYKSSDDVSFQPIEESFTRATTGVIPAATQSGPTTVVDKGTAITVDLITGTLSSVTEAQFLNLEQLALIGARGRWELVAFQNATLNGDGTYTLDTLLRGLQGTDFYMGMHEAGDTFLLLSTNTTLNINASANDFGAERYFRAASIAYQPVQDVPSVVHVLRSERLKPLPPVSVAGVRDSGTGDVVVSWIRQDRLGYRWSDYVDAPLSESTESYDIEIYNTTDPDNYVLVRTVEDVSVAAYTYTGALQTTDFGSPQSSITLQIFQKSSEVGRGFGAVATI